MADSKQRWHDLWIIAYGQAKVGNVEAVVRTAELASSMSVEARVGILSLAADTLFVRQAGHRTRWLSPG